MADPGNQHGAGEEGEEGVRGDLRGDLRDDIYGGSHAPLVNWAQSTDGGAQRVAANLARVRDRIALAAHRAGRDRGDIELVGVAKYVDAERAAMLLRAGCALLGESRPQQLWQKGADPRLAGARWHLIGHLQSNKVRRTLPFIDLLHSADSAALLQTLEEQATLQQLAPRVLLEVNCSGESQKHGLQPDQLRALVERLDEFPHLRVEGLMTMAAQHGGSAEARRSFAMLRTLRDALRGCCPACATLDRLSMGMSGDFEEAIAEGATLVRIGSLLWEGVA